MRIFIALLMLSSTAWGTPRVNPLVLTLPSDPSAVRAACDVAFREALEVKKAYESRPEINLKCLNEKTAEEIRDGFLKDCTGTFSARARGVPEGEQVKIDVPVLQDFFNYYYGAIFRRECLDKELAAFQVRKAQRERGAAKINWPAGYCDGINCQTPTPASSGAVR